MRQAESKSDVAKCALKFAKNVESLMAVTGAKEWLTKADLVAIMQALGVSQDSLS